MTADDLLSHKSVPTVTTDGTGTIVNKITTGDALSKIKTQLDWRGPTERVQGHVVLDRATAEFLHARVLELIRQQDAHVAEIDALKKLVPISQERRSD